MIEDAFFSQPLCDELVFEIKPVKSADRLIWHDAFGDSLTEIENAINKLENSGFSASIKRNNTVLSQYIGLKTCFKEKKGVYIYALCTNPLYRKKGYMKLLTEQSFEYGKNMDYDFFWLFPASEALEISYNRLGFTEKIPVGASPFPTDEKCFYNTLSFGNRSKDISFSSFDENYKRLYTLSDEIFDYDTFEYSLMGIVEFIEIKYINEGNAITGFVIFSKNYPDKVLYISKRYSHLIKTENPKFAYLYSISSSNYAEIYSAEPLPR